MKLQIAIILMLLLFCSCSSPQNSIELESLDPLDTMSDYECGYADGYGDGYSKGYEAGQDYNQLADMMDWQIIDYLNRGSHPEVYSAEEVYDIYIYGFQKGFLKCLNGVWDETTEEYVYGYDFSYQEPEYSFYFP